MTSIQFTKKHRQNASPFRCCIKIPFTLINICRSPTGLLSSLTRWLLSVSIASSLLIAVPLFFYSFRTVTQDHFSLAQTIKLAFVGWSSLLAISPWIVVVPSIITGFSLARHCHQCETQKALDDETIVPKSHDNNDWFTWISKSQIYKKSTLMKKSIAVLQRPSLRKFFHIVGLSFVIMSTISIQTNIQMLHPSWLWNPFLLGYNVYSPSTIEDSYAGLCIEQELNKNKDEIVTINSNLRTTQSRLCLPERSWKLLSTDAISPTNEDDVNVVLDGIRYLQKPSSGIAFGIMSRDTINAIEPLRQNVEALLPFTSNLAVVVFENDSSDGTREAFIEWSKNVEGRYIVDVIECKDSPGCKYNESHRDFEKSIPYEETSAIGRMGEFRQRLVDHVIEDSKYTNYSHYLVLDIDLAVSISPLGIIHSIGKLPNDTVASSGRQARPGSLGSLQPPYDFSAFVPYSTSENKRLRDFVKHFCALKPEKYRWRNECTAVSVAQFMMIQASDKLNDGNPYLVDSAFNGAVIYPLELVRKSRAKYDAGLEGQRCEHIGFNLSLKKPMYINPKWEMHLHPNKMGGPSGKRAMRTVSGIAKSPIISSIILGQSFVSMIVFIYCIMTLTILIIYPLWVYGSRCLFESSQNTTRAPNSISTQELEVLLNPSFDKIKKRKLSKIDEDFEFNFHK